MEIDLPFFESEINIETAKINFRGGFSYETKMAEGEDKEHHTHRDDNGIGKGRSGNAR